MAAKTVQRARDLLLALGFAAVLAEGRYLTRAERAAATEAHGGRQLRAASTRALTVPRAVSCSGRPSRPVQNVHLPRRGEIDPRTYVPKESPTRASARVEAAPRPLRRKRTQAPVQAPRGLDVQRLAAQLAQRMPWLAHSQHIGHLCSLIERAGLVARGWTASQILDQIDRTNRAGMIAVHDPAEQRDPLGYFAWNLARAIPADAIAPFAQLAAERAARQAERAAARAAEAARLDRIASQQNEISAIIEAMHRQFPRRQVVAK